MIKVRIQNPIVKLLGQKKQVTTYYNVDESQLPNNPFQKMVSKFKKQKQCKNMLIGRSNRDMSFQNYNKPLIYTESNIINGNGFRNQNSMQKLRRIYSQQKGIKRVTKRLFLNQSDNSKIRQLSGKKNVQRYCSFTKILKNQYFQESQQNDYKTCLKRKISQSSLSSGLKHQKLEILKHKLISSKREQGVILQRKKSQKMSVKDNSIKQNLKYVNIIEQQDFVNATDISNSELDMSPYLD